MRSRLIGTQVLDIHEREMVIQKILPELPQHWQWINVPLEVDTDIYPVDGIMG